MRVKCHCIILEYYSVSQLIYHYHVDMVHEWLLYTTLADYPILSRAAFMIGRYTYYNKSYFWILN
jgi:hypothetical protein